MNMNLIFLILQKHFRHTKITQKLQMHINSNALLVL